MRLKVILWKYEPRKDGTCNIKIYASIDGERTGRQVSRMVGAISRHDQGRLNIHCNHIDIVYVMCHANKAFQT